MSENSTCGIPMGVKSCFAIQLWIASARIKHRLQISNLRVFHLDKKQANHLSETVFGSVHRKIHLNYLEIILTSNFITNCYMTYKI